MQFIKLIIILNLITLTLLGLTACQHPVVNSEVAQIDSREPSLIVDAAKVVGDDPDLTLAAGPQIAGPEAVKDEELASIPEITPVELEVVVAKPITDIWQRVRNGLILDRPDIKRMRLQRDWYEKHQAYMDRVITRATPFLYLIVEEIEKRNMPMELVLLPIVESAYDPFAYSHGRASGMWQFIPGTGKRYGLKQNWWYDGRRDVVESTRAALDYLEYLHKHFKGDWLHALAAYNSGEGNVARAIKRNRKIKKDTDFWNLKLPRETKAYVPKLLALADLLANEGQFKIKWKEVPNKQLLKKVATNGQLDIAFAAKLAGITVDEFYKLNPAFNRWSTPPEGPHQVLIPIEKSEYFSEQLAKSDPSDRVQWIRYKVKSGDSLIRIAKNHNITPKTIRSVNNIRGNMIRAGDKIMIPTASQSLADYSLSSDSRLQARQKVQRGDNRVSYRVKSGDSFWKIARQYKVNLRKLAAWNGMAPTDPLKVNQKLVIWTKVSTMQTPSFVNTAITLNQNNRLRKINYRVRRGDSLSRISSKFSVKVADLKRWNNSIINKKYLQPGQRLTVYVDITNLSDT